MNEPTTPQDQAEPEVHPLMVPTDEYTMRHAANLLANFVRAEQSRLAESDIEVINFTYQQLHRGANTIHALEAP